MTTTKIEPQAEPASAEPQLNRAQRRLLAKVARKKPTRRKRIPHHVLQDPVGYLVETMRPLREQDGGRYVLLWKTRIHSAMRSVIRGEARRSDMNDLVAGWNITSALCNIHGFEDPCVVESRNALVDLCLRANEMQRVVAKAPEIKSINEMIELHDEWIEAITVGQMEEALAWAKRKENETHVISSKGIPE